MKRPKHSDYKDKPHGTYVYMCQLELYCDHLESRNHAVHANQADDMLQAFKDGFQAAIDALKGANDAVQAKKVRKNETTNG